MIHTIARIVQIIAILGCICSSTYYLLCLWSAFSFLRFRKAIRTPAAPWLPPVSILKPLKGVDPDIYESFRSHCLQDYPDYEIIFGVSDANDPAVASVKDLQAEFRDRNIRLIICPRTLGANIKVSNLSQMLRAVRYDYLIVNDSDIQVEKDYLRRMVAPLNEEKVGMVTCLYRGIASQTLGSRLESLGIAADFCPGVLAAKQLEGMSFGLGSTMAFRKKDLEQIGGFESIADFLADDYELGRRFAGLGLRVLLSDVVVETHLPAYSMDGFLSHQLRWARGVRDSRAGGYVGLAATFGLFWGLALVIAAPGTVSSWLLLAATGILRVAVALVVGKSVLQDAQLLPNLWLLPIRDLVAVGVWIASFAGHTVTWRGDRFRLKNGRLTRIAP